MADNPIYQRNQQWTVSGEKNYSTDLGDKEADFQAWLKQNKVPFDPAEQEADYDMRGFYKALQDGDPKAKEALNPNDNQMHFPDYWKTPYHKSFSAESQWADPKKAPAWNEQDQLVLPNGQVVYDERAEAVARQQKKQQQNAALAAAVKGLFQRLQQKQVAR